MGMGAGSTPVGLQGSPAPDAARPERGLLTAWLLLLLRDGATYGYNLRRQLQVRGMQADPAAMYRMLRSYEDEGWVQSRWATSDTGPQRRIYRLTRKGRRVLAELAGVIAASRDTQDRFLIALALPADSRPPRQ